MQVAIFLAMGVHVVKVTVCSLFVYRWTSTIASFSHVALFIPEQRARSVTCKHDRLRKISLSCVKRMELKLLVQAHLLSVLKRSLPSDAPA